MIRETKVAAWIADVTLGLDFQVLTPSGWFGDITMEILFGLSLRVPLKLVWNISVFIRLKRPNSMHVLVVPRLMIGRWQRHLRCGTDGCSLLEDVAVWDLKHHYEPSRIFYACFFHSDNPTLEEQGHLLERFQRTLYEQRVPLISTGRRRDILRQLFWDGRRLWPLQGCLVWALLQAAWV